MDEIFDLEEKSFSDEELKLLLALAEESEVDSAQVDFCLAMRYRTGFAALEQDEKEAIRYFVLAMLKGFEPSGDELYIMMCDNGLSEEENRQLMSYMEEQAENTNAGAMYVTALCKERDGLFEEAAALYEKASALGHVEALYRLGLLHHDRDMIRKAADGECSRAMYNLALELEESAEEALVYSLYQKVYEREGESGAFHLARCYAYGIGVEKDEEEAYNLFSEAVDYEMFAVPELPGLNDYDEEERQYKAEASLFIAKYLINHPEEEGDIGSFLEDAYNCAENHSKEGTEALYYVGYNELFGIWGKANIEGGIEDIADAAQDGHEEAQILLDKIESHRRFLADLKEADREQRKAEACRRLMILEKKGFDPEVRARFEKGDLSFGADDVYGTEVFCEKTIHTEDYQAIKAVVDQLEARGNTVYYIQRTLTWGGVYANLFFVSPYPCEWENDCRNLIREYPIVAVADPHHGDIEIGSIGINIEKGSMERWQ